MARYKVQGPDGQTRELDGPDGATDEQIIAVAQKLLSAPPAKPLERGDSIKQGMVDPINGGAQLLTKMLPAGVVKAGDQFNNWLADKTGLVGKLPEGGVDAQVRQQEAEYQARRAAGGESGIDGGRLVGNVVSPATIGLGGASMVAKGAPLVARIGSGVAAGAASSALAPVTDGEYGTEKAKQVALGGVLGGAAVPVASGLARVISPLASKNPKLDLLKQEGVRPSIGQTLGGVANNLEEKLTSVPVVGGMIRNARLRGVEDLNAAAYNRALKPVGESLPKDMLGRDAVDYVGSSLGQKYDALLPRMTTPMDGQFITGVNKLRNMISGGSIAPAEAQQFENILQSQVLGKFQGNNPTLTGETLKDIQSNLGQLAGKYMSDPSADKRMLGEAIGEVRNEMLKMAGRANPAEANALKAIDTGYANFKRVQRAAAGLGAEEGIFSAAQLQGAVKAADRSKDKSKFAKGDALMQDLSEAGKSVLGPKVPDSGTAGRLAVITSPVAIWMAVKGAPVAAAVAALSPLAYTKAGQAVLRQAVSARPELAEPVAEAIRKASPGFGVAAAQIGTNALK